MTYVAPAGVAAPAGAFLSLPKHYLRKNPSIMTDDLPARVTPNEISAFLDQLRAITSDTPLEERIRFFERKAHLLSRVANDLNTAEAYQVAADARVYADRLARQHDQQPGAEVRP
jgi:hypothetical protein